MPRTYDLLVFGATGFTGGLVVDYMAQNYAGKGIKWAIAGRSRDKLESVRERLREAGAGADEVGVEVVNALDADAVAQVVKKTRVILTTVGPFTLYGGELVAACAREGTHYVDSTGEGPWVRRMIDQHHEAARASGARIMSCCGFDSIPSDVGALMLADHARREYGRGLRDVRAFVSSNGTFSGGTMASMFTLIERGDMKDSGNPFLLNPDKAPAAAPNDTDSDVLFPAYSREARCWTVPWIMAAINTRIVRRSHALLRDTDRDYGPSFHYNEVMRASSFLGAVCVWLGLAFFFAAVQLSFVRSIARRFLPSPGQGPSAERRAASWFRMKLIASLDEVPSGGNAAKAPPTLIGTIAGGDPGYTETAKMLAETALAVVLDEPKLPAVSGLVTPAAGVGTQLIHRLREAGMVLEVKPGH